MNRIIIICCLALSFFGAERSNAQDTMIVMELDEHNTPSFHLEGVNSDRVVWFFGDGHYSFAAKPKHNFKDGGNTTENITVYHMQKYIPLPPTLVAEDFIHNDTGNSFVNPSYHTEVTEPIGVDVSAMWDPVLGQEMIYTTLITNNETGSIEGDLEFKFPTEILDEHPNLLSGDINNEEWFNFSSIVNNTDENTTSILFTVNAIPPGKQRLLHLRLNVNEDYTGDDPITTESIFISKKGDMTNNKSVRRIKGSPHDPNYKWRDKKAICSNSLNPGIIQYEIHFQNEGDGFAVDVVVDDLYSAMNLIQNYDILEYSIQPTQHEMTNNKIVFKFDNANLPGSNQHYPIQYSFEQTQGFIRYKVFTKPCLFKYGVNQLVTFAKIIFDSEPPVETVEVITEISNICFDQPECSTIEDIYEIKTKSWDTEENTELEAFPNPHFADLNISMDGSVVFGKTSIIVTDALGRQIERFEKVIPKNEKYFIHLDTKNWNLGLHLILIQNDTFRKSLRCIKQE